MSLFLTTAVVATWIGMTALLFGIGAVFLTALVRVERTWADALLAVLCGFSLLFGALLIWHFLLPVDEVALLTFAIVGGLALVHQRDWVSALGHTSVSKLHAIPILVFTIWAANHALLRGGWDDYMYEFHAIRWFHDFPIVPGLANLHGRLGFSSAQHLYGALLSAGPWAGAANLVVNGLFVVLAFALSWSACADLLRNRISERAVFAAAFLAPCVAPCLLFAEISQPQISTLKADVAAAALTIAVGCLWLELADRATAATRRCALAVTIALTSATLFSIRASSVVFVAIIIVAVFAWIASNSHSRRLLLPVGAVVGVIIAAVLLRGVVLSGYALYPSTLIAADVDWRVPKAQADVERTFVTTSAQLRPTYDLTPPTGGWLLHWARDTILTSRTTLLVPVVLTLTLLPFFAGRTRETETASVSLGWWAVLWSASIAALVVWFVHAPAGRFAWGYWWILAASVLARVFNRRSRGGAVLWPALGAGLVAGAVIWGFEPRRSEIVGFFSVLIFVVGWCTTLSVAVRRRPIAIGMLCLALGAYPIVDRLSADVLHRSVP